MALAGASAARAQDGGEIAGRVLDGSGVAVPGVAVTLTGPILLQAQHVTSAANGAYRFPRVAVGTYAVTFDAAGFKTLVREGVAVELGFHVIVNAALELAAARAVVTATGGTGIVDTRSTAWGAQFTREAMDLVPTSRGTRAILALTPGVAVARGTVAATLRGQGQDFASRGDAATSAIWSLDGIEITASRWRGGSPVDYDFDSFQEIQVATGGTGPSRMSGGLAVNMVTRSGTDRFRGSARFLATDEHLQSENLDAALRAQGAGNGSPIQSARDVGIEAGGPVIRGRAWLWGSLAQQVTKVGVDLPLETLRRGSQTDLTKIWEMNLKSQVQISRQNTVTWFNNFTEKLQPTSGGSATRPVETTYRVHGAPSAFGTRLWTTGPASIWRANDRHVFTERWLAEVQWVHVGNSSASDFQDEALADVQPRYEISTMGWSRSYRRVVSLRSNDSVDVSTDYFRPSWLGGGHVIEAAWRWRAGASYDERHVGGNAVARYRDGVPAEATLWRDSETAYRLDTQAAWVQDTYTRRGLTVDLGLRWDRQRDRALPSRVPAHPFEGQLTADGAGFRLLPAVMFGGADPGVVWNDFSPRLGVAYDLTGNGRTVVKGSFRRYFRQLTSASWSKSINPVTAASVRLPWSDVNGDGFVQAAEVDATRILSFSGNHDPRDPGLPGTSNSVDPEAKNQTTDEVIVGLDREVGPEFGVGLSYTWRRYTNFPWDDSVGMTSADYVERTYTPPAANCPAGARCETVEYWEPSIPMPSRHVATNRPDADRRYHGIEIAARKRMSHGWMMTGSLSLNDVREYFRSPRAYEDPTNIDKLNGRQWSAGADARWLVKLSGAYTLPWRRVRLAGVYEAREGRAWSPAIQTPARANSAGIATVLLDPMGEVRLPVVRSLDAGASLPVRMGPVRLTATVDVFNLMNANTVLRRERIQNAATANQATLIVGPRVVRLGVKATW